MTKTPSSKTKVLIILLLSSLSILILGFSIGGRFGLLIGFLLIVSFYMLVLFFGKTKILEAIEARPLIGQDPWSIINTLEKYSKLLDIEAPNVYIVDTDKVFAFALSGDLNFSLESLLIKPDHHGIICVSIGLITRLRSAEVEALLARQVAQVAKANTFSKNLAHVLSFSILGLGIFLDQFWPTQFLKRGHKRKKYFSNLLSPVAWFVLKQTFSNQFYFTIDEIAARLIHDRQILAEALWKLNGYALSHPLQIPACTQQYFVVNPLGIKEKNHFLLTHPNIDIRIKKLIGYFPL